MPCLRQGVGGVIQNNNLRGDILVYIIKHLRLKTYLESLGFICEGAMPDRYNPRYSVFLFKDTKELRQALDSYKA